MTELRRSLNSVGITDSVVDIVEKYVEVVKQPEE